MGGSTFRVGRLLGIPIGIHPLWLVVVGLITWTLGSTYFPDADPGLDERAAYALGFVGALGLFAGIVLHELAHAVVARRHGIRVEEIDLWLLGGVVVDRGASLSHAAIVGREYGIPVVMNVFEGTKVIKDGMRIRVDGNMGTVTIVND